MSGVQTKSYTDWHALQDRFDSHRTVVDAVEVDRALDIDLRCGKRGALEVVETVDPMLVDAGARHEIQNVADPNHNSRVIQKDGVIDKNTLQLTRGREPP